MANKDTSAENIMNVTRRVSLNFPATAAAVGGGWSLGFDPSVALAYEDNPTDYQIKQTTCPYCSASCGQRVVVDNASGEVIDIYRLWRATPLYRALEAQSKDEVVLRFLVPNQAPSEALLRRFEQSAALNKSPLPKAWAIRQMICQSALAWPSGSMTLRTRWTRRSPS